MYCLPNPGVIKLYLPRRDEKETETPVGWEVLATPSWLPSGSWRYLS